MFNLQLAAEVLTTSGTVADTSGLGQGGLVPVEGGVNMWEKITSGVSSFISGVVTPVASEVSQNEIALAFLAVTFTTLGVRMLRRIISAFGRGR